MAITDTLGVRNLKGNFFDEIRKDSNFVGHLYDLDYEKANIMVNDYRKNEVKGIPHGCFLIALFHNEISKEQNGILLRVIGVAEIPQKKEIIASITDNYMAQEKLHKEIEPDIYTKNFYQFSGLSCRVLGTFYFNRDNRLTFGTDIENFIGAHNYLVYKPKKEQLDIIINQNANKDSKEQTQEIGILRYSSSQSYDDNDEYAPKVLLRTNDIVARRSAFFGMTRMGKSNTIKIIISAIESLNENLENKIGQIIFDINGEYTFSNEQDKGSIYDKFKDKALRFSTSLKKTKQHKDVRAVQYNFYNDDTLEESFNLLCDELDSVSQAHYFTAFKNVRMFEDIDDKNSSEYRNMKRKQALYKCILAKAGFSHNNQVLKFSGFTTSSKLKSVPKEGLSIKDSIDYFSKIEQDLDNVDEKYKKDNDWQALLKVFHGSSASGFRVLMQFSHLHSLDGGNDYKKEIDSALREGKIVLVDLSTASTQTQQKYIDRLCSFIFNNSMEKFTKEENPEFIQMYFEEAHNIFPKDDKDLKNIYNRLAKEGAKLNIGISYSTQEVSSIAPSILKNTQNWFISHLNNADEIRALEKYYDFKDFSQSIIRNADVGFARVKTFSNNFIIPVQIKKFES